MMMIIVMTMTLLEPLMINDFDGALEMDDVVQLMHMEMVVVMLYDGDDDFGDFSLDGGAHWSC
jgi:hypothetical protein